MKDAPEKKPEWDWESEENEPPRRPRSIPGKSTVTSMLSTAMLSTGLPERRHEPSAFRPPARASGGRDRALVQRKERDGREVDDNGDPVATALTGISSAGGALPHLDSIQRSFGAHDLSSVRSHDGSAAQAANQRLGANAYAVGDDVVFRQAPDLHTAAHEAAHVVQQRRGVSVPGNLGRAGDAYEREADRVADAVVAGRSAEPLLGPIADRVSARAVQRDIHDAEGSGHEGESESADAETEETEEVNYVFFFVGNDAYGRGARAYIAANYADYEQVRAHSLEEMFARMHSDLRERHRRGRRLHVGHVILVSHAILSQVDGADGDGAVTQGELFISPTRGGDDQRVSAATLSDLQGEFRQGLHQRFRRQRGEVVAEAIDASTVVEVRGCRVAQAEETSQALRSVFGGAAALRSPEDYQGYAIIPYPGLGLERAVDILIEQGSVPASFRQRPVEEQREYVEELVRRHGGLPTQHFLEDGEREAFEQMSRAEQLEHLGQARGDQGPAVRDQVDLPTTEDGRWRYARDPSDSRTEGERRDASAEALEGLDDSDDPIAGIEDELDDIDVVGRRASRAPGDSFEDEEIIYTPASERQQRMLEGEPDQAAVSSEDGGRETTDDEPARSPGAARRPGRGRSGSRRQRSAEPATAPATGATTGLPALHMRSFDGRYIVMDRASFRAETIRFLFCDGFVPSEGQLVGRDYYGEDGLILGTEAWAISRSVVSQLRPDIVVHMAQLGQRAEARATEGEALAEGERETTPTTERSGSAASSRDGSAATVDIVGNYPLPEVEIETPWGKFKTKARVQLRRRILEARETSGVPSDEAPTRPSSRPEPVAVEGGASAGDGSVAVSGAVAQLGHWLGTDFGGFRDRVELNRDPGGLSFRAGFDGPTTHFGPIDARFRFNLIETDRGTFRLRPPSLTMILTTLWLDVGDHFEDLQFRARLDETFTPNYGRIGAWIAETFGGAAETAAAAGATTAGATEAATVALEAELAGAGTVGAAELAAAALPVVASLVWMGVVVHSLMEAEEEGRRRGAATWYTPAYAHQTAGMVFDEASHGRPVPRDFHYYQEAVRANQAGTRDAIRAFRRLSPAQVTALRNEHGDYATLGNVVAAECAARLGIPAPRIR